MKVLAFKNLHREESYIYYIRKFTGVAVLQIPGGTLEVAIAFTIETTPFGTKNIDLEIENEKGLEYPVLPIRKSLTDNILATDNEGGFPL